MPHLKTQPQQCEFHSCSFDLVASHLYLFHAFGHSWVLICNTLQNEFFSCMHDKLCHLGRTLPPMWPGTNTVIAYLATFPYFIHCRIRISLAVVTYIT